MVIVMKAKLLEVRRDGTGDSRSNQLRFFAGNTAAGKRR